MTRTEHIKWCVDRAEMHLDKSELSIAIASFFSDMSKHEETAYNISIFITTGIVEEHIKSIPEFRRWINGFQ